MGSTTKYTCDRCSCEVKGSEDLIVVTFKITTRSGTWKYEHAGPAAEWCRDCTNKFQLLGIIKPKDEPAPPPIPLSDKIEALLRDLIQEEIESAKMSSM